VGVERLHAAIVEAFYPLSIFPTCTFNMFLHMWKMKNVTTIKILVFWAMTL
jgi:hypothetical protein